jgi:hypothetical protein
MYETRNLRAKPGGSDDAWAAYDAAFRDAFERLERAGCEIGIIASNTPHTRLASIRRGLRLPIISILDETARATVALRRRKALVLGTDVTMRSDDYPAALRALGVEPKPAETLITVRGLPENRSDQAEAAVSTRPRPYTDIEWRNGLPLTKHGLWSQLTSSGDRGENPPAKKGGYNDDSIRNRRCEGDRRFLGAGLRGERP